jgi:transposase
MPRPRIPILIVAVFPSRSSRYRVDAQRILKEEFDIDCSLSSTYRLLHRLKLSWLAPRPRHPEADATAQTAFSQLLDCN